MHSSLIRGKYVICKVLSRTDVEIIEDGAIFQQNGKIIEIGKYADLTEKYQPDQILGSSEDVVLPGLINCHHHVGLTPFQLGSPDYPLELWFASRLAARNVDLYLDTLYSAFEMIESGVTTVQHIHGWRPGPASTWFGIAEQVLQAYYDIGMRSSYCFAVRDQNHFVYEANEEFVKKLPADIAPEVAAILKAQEVPLQDYLDFFEHLWHKWDRNADGRIHIQLAPANLHWCSDEALEKLQAYALKYDVGMHMHLLETAYQKVYAQKRTGKTAVRHLHDLGILGSHLTLGHGVWLTEDDIDLVAESSTMICHNASSNLRLQSGIAPLNHYVKRGVTVGMGLDEAGINDDRDMLQEMRLVLKLHRVPGMDELVPTSPQVFQMATEHGAKTTGFANEVGTLEAGKAADIVIMNWQHIAYPYLDQAIPILDAVLHRSRTSGVETVIVAGEVIYKEGKFTKVDKAEALEELANSLKVPLTPAEERRCILAQEVFPYVKKFYDGWLDHSHCDPFYCQNARH
ncbi:amidohydrolase family protein [Gloeocapsopsis dulcis]|uniref:Amidohydrolase n=1 Tax=Gloeocapsopsis dulcis AAB1 = 1H9 TaxID=1433147 RepID=A0A6N8FTX0_9CHRO|nr:amidohydrolase family protein [Gloeocapsopsis dulcis]MUL36214.1 amidohydrolase [Gloeocapsopsis dulcis AAB1 = 1H9]WNN89675.1 amidohydrolase family protein [Gloeocapsopsis dulcis]